MPTPKDTSQFMADIQQCWKGTGYHTSFAGRAQRPPRTPRSADSRDAITVQDERRLHEDAVRRKSERQPMPGAGAASHNEAARERIRWLFCYWHT
jgi:hypothetical protein